MSLRSFFAELKRRNVYKVAVAYAVVAWLLIQAASIFFPAFDAPPWVMKIFIIVIIFGFPVALILSWAFEITPEGIKLESEIEPNKSITRRTGRKIVAVTIALAVIAAGLFVYQLVRSNNAVAPRQSEAATVPQKSIAVLPFVDLSQAKDQEYFCDGISEEILDALAKVEGLRVVARTSSFSFKGKSADVGEIAQKLNVQNVLEGSLRREGNRVRITAQLVARDGFHLWSETYDRELQDVFAMQDEITRSIVDALKIKLAVSLPAREQRNTEAYDLYLQGLYFSNKSGEEDLRRALSFFQRALDKDPAFGRAWTGVAKAWVWLADAYVKPLEAFPKVKEAATKAITLDERDAEAHVHLGLTKGVLDWDPIGEEAELKRALQLDPNSVSARLSLAYLRLCQGDIGKELPLMAEAKKLDPLSPMVSWFVSWGYFAADRFDDAIAEGQRTVQLDPSYFYLGSVAALAYREKGDFEKAISLYNAAQQATHSPSSGLAITYARMGRQAEARHILDQLLEKARTQYVAADSIAGIYVALGENDEAFRWLERAYAEHSALLRGIGPSRTFRPLRADPRFADLLRRMGFDPAKILGQQKDQ
jgi:adenylate cyclase